MRGAAGKGNSLEFGSRRVAVVEDNRSMRKSIERLLNAHGLKTEGYASAEVFLNHATATEIDCIVIDIHLDGMSGIALRHGLKTTHSRLPVIFITAIDDDALEAEARGAGCVAYLHKPFAAASLIHAIDKALATD
ncbi:response regulator transcription factor [Sinorhizobium fredii]|uniref:response regulator transcription factor n=1 Tax=Rhizobium fredii TaxID=380 RepID=UPI000563F749|nr:response regulator [Sinorhizobium fredii]MQW99504.1 response regulator [Sinorhizobium fredii]UTY46844.1 response regulator [Sinorhizobium fredii]